MTNRYALIGLNLLTALIILVAVLAYQNGFFGPTEKGSPSELAVDLSPIIDQGTLADLTKSCAQRNTSLIREVTPTSVRYACDSSDK